MAKEVTSVRSFREKFSNCHDCQVLRDNMPLISRKLKVLNFSQGHLHFRKGINLESQIKCYL